MGTAGDDHVDLLDAPQCVTNPRMNAVSILRPALFARLLRGSGEDVVFPLLLGPSVSLSQDDDLFGVFEAVHLGQLVREMRIDAADADDLSRSEAERHDLVHVLHLVRVDADDRPVDRLRLREVLGAGVWEGAQVGRVCDVPDGRVVPGRVFHDGVVECSEHHASVGHDAGEDGLDLTSDGAGGLREPERGELVVVAMQRVAGAEEEEEGAMGRAAGGGEMVLREDLLAAAEHGQCALHAGDEALRTAEEDGGAGGAPLDGVDEVLQTRLQSLARDRHGRHFACELLAGELEVEIEVDAALFPAREDASQLGDVVEHLLLLAEEVVDVRRGTRGAQIGADVSLQSGGLRREHEEVGGRAVLQKADRLDAHACSDLHDHVERTLEVRLENLGNELGLRVARRLAADERRDFDFGEDAAGKFGKQVQKTSV